MYSRRKSVVSFSQLAEFKLVPLQLRWILGLILIGYAAAVPTSWAACIGPTAITLKLQAKSTAEVHAELGNWFADKKEYECAAQSFARAARLRPDSLTFQYLLGLSLHSAGRENEALAPLMRAEHLDPGDIRPHLALGVTLDRLSRISEAEDEWRRALAIDIDSSPARDALSQDLLNQKDYTAVIALLAKSGRNHQRTEQQNLNLGIAYARSAQLDEAAEVLRDGLKDAPGSLPIANQLAMILVLLSRNDEAFEVFNLALKHHPDDVATQVLYLRTMVSSHSDEATGYAQQMLSKYPDQWEILYLNGLIALNDGDFKKTRALVSRSIELHPNSPEAQQLLGSTLARLGDFAGAKEHLEKAIALGADSPECHYELGKVLQNLGETEKARGQLQQYQKIKSAQSDRSQAAGKAEEGDQAMADGDVAKAITLYQSALNSDPDEPLLHYKLARAFDKANDLAQEKAVLARAIELDPNLPEAQNQMGYLAVREGDAAQAEARFRAAVQASPSYITAWINLGALLASEAKWQEARQAATRALAIDPDNAQARNLLDKLKAADPEP